MSADREAVDLDALTARAEALLAVADRASNLVDFPGAVEATTNVTRDAPALIRDLLAALEDLPAKESP